MSLNSFVKTTAVPELFERLQADAEQFRGDLERLQRFVELAMAKPVVAPAFNPVAKEQDLDSWLQEDEWQKCDSLSAFVDGSVPEPSTPAPVKMESSARQQLEDDADEAARTMVFCFELMQQQRQPTSTSLACALRVMRKASAGFECSQTMQAIIKALDEIGTAAKEAQNNG